MNLEDISKLEHALADCQGAVTTLTLIGHVFPMLVRHTTDDGERLTSENAGQVALSTGIDHVLDNVRRIRNQRK